MSMHLDTSSGEWSAPDPSDMPFMPSQSHNVTKRQYKPRKPPLIENPKQLALAFSYAVTAGTQTADSVHWIARNGDDSLFQAMHRMMPKVPKAMTFDHVLKDENFLLDLGHVYRTRLRINHMFALDRWPDLRRHVNDGKERFHRPNSTSIFKQMVSNALELESSHSQGANANLIPPSNIAEMTLNYAADLRATGSSAIGDGSIRASLTSARSWTATTMGCAPRSRASPLAPRQTTSRSSPMCANHGTAVPGRRSLRPPPPMLLIKLEALRVSGSRAFQPPAPPLSQ